MSTAKKKAAKKTATSKSEAKLICTVTASQAEVGSMIFAKGKRFNVSESKAKALEKLGKVRIDGVA
jgi:hypothetical protein